MDHKYADIEDLALELAKLDFGPQWRYLDNPRQAEHISKWYNVLRTIYLAGMKVVEDEP